MTTQLIFGRTGTSPVPPGASPGELNGPQARGLVNVRTVYSAGEGARWDRRGACPTRINCIVTVRALLLLFLLCREAFSFPPEYYSVDLSCEAQPSRPALRLNWPQVDYAREYIVRRRTNNLAPWGDPVAVLPGESTGFTDVGIKIGVAYEYEVEMQLSLAGYDGGLVRAYSYLSAGMNVPVTDAMGTVLLLVDSTVAGEISAALAVYEQDLVGDGWRVVRREVNRVSRPLEVKQLVLAEYSRDTALRTLALIGHVPVPYSGNIAPDFHERHRGAWPADAYYGDLTGTWTDSIVSITSQDSEDNDNSPGDGKFDQSDLPATVALEVGRIDFWNLPSFAPSTEVDLLNRYFKKNHEFRHRTFTAARRGLVHDNFGDVEGDAPAVDAWRHFTGFFGPGRLLEVGPNQFLPVLNQESYLWAYGAGGGSFGSADGVADTAGFAANSPKAVFMILHGSYFGDWNSEDNLLRGALASPGMSLASIWSGLPHWYLHPVALGATIGFSTRLTQNNRDTYKSYRNFSANQVHIALLGDPTLEMYPVAPPRDFTARVSGGAVELSWSPSPDENVTGYRVLASPVEGGPYESLTPEAITETRYSTSGSGETRYYMVRAIKLERTGSGTYYHASQGVFVRVEAVANPVTPTAAISLDAGNKIVVRVSGRPNSSFQVQQSTNGQDWNSVASGISDATGHAEFRDPEMGAHLKLYRVLWP